MHCKQKFPRFAYVGQHVSSLRLTLDWPRIGALKANKRDSTDGRAFASSSIIFDLQSEAGSVLGAVMAQF
jgi:hypothetical protein